MGESLECLYKNEGLGCYHPEKANDLQNYLEQFPNLGGHDSPLKLTPKAFYLLHT